MIKTAKTQYGTVRGRSASDPRIIAYLGVPFAAPPTGELRWRAPQPHEGWEGVRDCLEFAPISMQSIPGVDTKNIYSREWNVDPEIPMSEDCLYLNVWTPAKTPDEKLPVFVWFFGGGLQVGNTAEMEFDGERIARRGIVVVTVNYRVNSFGFLCHPEITKEAPDAPANFGNLDQRAGIIWTYNNIAAFGGDPESITIGGQSAGGGSVATLLNYPGNKKYIKRAIIDSGVFYDIYSVRHAKLSFAEAEAYGDKFFEHLGVKTLAQARAIPENELRDKTDSFRGFFGTQNDGVFQTDAYMNNIKSGDFLDIPILLGHTNNEFTSACRVKSADELTAYAKSKFGAKADEFLKLIEADRGLEYAVKASDVSSIEFAIRAIHRNMKAAKYKSQQYYYEFGAEIPGWDNPGAFHSIDLWFWFETLAKCWRPFTGGHYDLSRQMCNYWCNFIRSGDPNGVDADGREMERWLPYDEENNACMELYTSPKLTERKPSTVMKFLLDNID